MKPMKRMHCPNCQSNRLTPVVETEFNSRRTNWKCEHCGHTFRNLSSLEAELNAMEKNVEAAFHGILLTLILCLLSSQMISLDASLLFYVPSCCCAAAAS